MAFLDKARFKYAFKDIFWCKLGIEKILSQRDSKQERDTLSHMYFTKDITFDMF